MKRQGFRVGTPDSKPRLEPEPEGGLALFPSTSFAVFLKNQIHCCGVSSPPSVGQKDFLLCVEGGSGPWWSTRSFWTTPPQSPPTTGTLGSLKVPQLPHLCSSVHFADKMVGMLNKKGPGCQRNLGASPWQNENF